MGTIEINGQNIAILELLTLTLLSILLIALIVVLIRVLIRIHRLKKFIREIDRIALIEDQEDEEIEVLEEDSEEEEDNGELIPLLENSIIDLKPEAEENLKTPCPRRLTLEIRLNNATDNLRARYSVIRNYLESFKVRERFLKHRDIYFIMKENIEKSEDGSIVNKSSAYKLAMLTIYRKTLMLSLNIERELTDEEKELNVEMTTRRYDAYNFNMRVSDKTDLEKALSIIENLLISNEVPTKKKHEDVDYADIFNVKLTNFESRGFGYLLRESVTLQEADQLTDSLSKRAVIIKKVNDKPLNNDYAEISLDVIRDNFGDGAKINILSLKDKKLIDPKCAKVIVTDGTSLDKKLFIEADGYSSNALKMIFLVGGEAKVIQRGVNKK